MASGGGSAIGGTFTSGIQDISAFLPLLGTEQCEEHIGSVLTKGYIYAAATPMSIFGSLGLASAGLKAFVAAISFPRLSIDGARLLADAGFEPKGKNQSLIMLDENQEGQLARERLQSMMKELHIEDSSSKVTVESNTWDWGVQMILWTAISCIVSITPYIHLNLHENRLDHLVRWGFPVTRAIGGFLTATMIQLLTQSRLLEIMRKQLILDDVDDTLRDLGISVEEKSRTCSSLDQRCSFILGYKLNTSPSNAPAASHVLRDTSFAQADALEKGEDTAESKAEVASPSPTQHRSAAEKLESLQDRILKSYGSSVLRGITLVLLLIGIIASVAGYIGCFSVVQGAESSGEALIWVSLEAVLCVIRIILWAINPKSDDAPRLKLKLGLDKHPPLPTCTFSAQHIEKERILPLVPATEFLQMITSYTGLLKRFSHPSLTLYYTLTRSYDATSEPQPDPTSEEPQLGEHVLYTTIFHHIDRTTRVYAKNFMGSETSYFYSADPVTLDRDHCILKTTIRQQIQHPDDPIADNATLRTLQDHYQSILNQVNCRIAPPPGPNDDVLKNNWTLKLVRETESEIQTRGAEWAKTRHARGNERPGGDDSESVRDREYLEQGRRERKVRDLSVVRGQWIKDYMEWFHRDIDRVLEMENIDKEKERNVLLIREQEQMENVLVDEVYEWEKELRISLLGFTKKHPLNDRLREQLERNWRARSWERWEKWGLTRMGKAESGFLADAGKEGTDETHFKKQSNCDDGIRRTWESLSAPNCVAPSPRHGTLTERLESRLKGYHSPWNDLGLSSSKARYYEGLQKNRLLREVTGVEERLHRGFEACHESWSDTQLISLTHSDSKWLRYYPSRDKYGVMGRALINNHHVIHVTIDVTVTSLSDADVAQFFRMTCEMAACSSVRWFGTFPASVELPHNILFLSGCQLSEGQKATLNQNISRSDRDQKTTFEFKHMYVRGDGGDLGSGDLVGSGDCSFTVRFSGPSSGRHLKLQLSHHSESLKGLLAVELGENSCEPIPLSNRFAWKEITIWNRSQLPPEPACGRLIFTPDARNSLVCTFKAGTRRDLYHLRDIKLLNETGSLYE